MENFKVIEFHRTRDFSNKMSATFEFIKQNFRGLFKSILVIAGPPTLLASLIFSSFFSDIMSFSQQASTGQVDAFQNYFFSVNFWLQIALLMLFLITSGVMNLATINNYIILYAQKRTNQITVAEVWQRVRDTFWMYFGTILSFSVLFIAAYIVLLIPIAFLGAISEVLVVFGVIFFFCALIYIVFSASLVFIIRGYEKLGFFESVTRSFKLVKDKWWSTFGLVFVLYLIVGVVSYLFMIPGYIFMFISTLHSTSVDGTIDPSSSLKIILMVSMTLYYLAQMVLAALPYVGIAFQYFNLVELKEAKGLIADIQTLGDQPAHAQTDEQY